jgi:hypothetical protein
MERLIIDTGTAPDSGDGDTLYESFSKVNANFEFLFVDQENSNVFNSSYIALTPSSEEIINGVTDFGLLVNLTPSYYVTMMYDSSLTRLDPSTGQIENGAFRVQDSNNSLVGIYTNSINTYDNQNLNLISSGTGIVSVTGTFNYEQQVFNYVNGNIDINSPIDPDALVNAQSMIDYVTAVTVANQEDRIVAISDPTTYVEVISGSEKTVNVVLGSSTIAEFSETSSRIHRIVISDNQIRAIGTDNLLLQPGLGGYIDVSNSRITGLADPIDLQDAVTLQYLNSQLSSIGSFDNVDLTNLQDGSLLIYNIITSKFEASTLLTKQQIDAGTY